ncbi:MAG: hypothetical protein AAF938_30650 [Myxococcota bacterium]
MAEVEEIVVKFAAPIPLGHEIEVVWYEVIKTGWSGVSAEDRPYVPRIVDRTTGIEYLNATLVSGGGIWDTSQPLSISEEVRAPFEECRVLIGTVRRCRLVTIGSNEVGIQTHLRVEAKRDEPAYR